MRAKWLWMSWAYVGLAIVISLEALFIAFIAMFIAPKFQLLMRDGLLDPAMIAEPAVSWMLSLLHGVWTVGEKYTTLFVLLAAAAWALFEWRVRSENKPLMRLSALATAAVALMAVVVLTAGSLVVLFCLGMPDAYRMARPFALNQISQISASVGALEQAMVKKDWETMREHVDRASGAIKNLANAAPAVPALATKNEPPTPEQLRAHVAAASEAIVSAQRAIDQRNVAQLEAAMEKFRQSYEPVREAALRGEK